MPIYRCPHCQNEISLADVNVASDVALCRKCGTATAFSAVSGVAELNFAQLDEPMKGVTLQQSMVGGTEIVYRHMSKIVFFLIPFAAVWGGFSLNGIYGSQFRSGHFDPSSSLFGLPFLLGTLVMIYVILFQFFGKWRVRMDRGQGEVYVGIGLAGWTRRFIYAADSVVSLEVVQTQKNNVSQRAITVKTGDRKIKFGTMIPEDAKRYLAALILRECAAA